MLLGELLRKVHSERCVRFAEKEITGVSTDSKHVMNGDLFVCFAGGEHDGHDYAAEALASGAVALVVERELDFPVPQVIVKDGRSAVGEIAAAFYGHPEEKLKIIGITGTNGKTTTAHMLVVFLYKIFADMVESGIEYAVMEVSAHALYFGKTDGIKFEAAIFTNFTEDHLDFFKTMGAYAAAKEKLFQPGRCKFAVLNYDDEEGRKIGSFCEKAYSYGLENPADVFAVDIREDIDGSVFVINLFDELYDIRLHMPGLYNVYNAMAAAACAKILGVSVPMIAAGLSGLPRVSGRLEHIARYRGADIFVDFAHTPDGLEKSLTALRKHCGGRLICVFGCGGNRDALKRPIMGETAAKIADFCVLTSDNPRYEDPFDIILQIEEGVRRVSDEYVIVVDRECGIGYALDMLKAGDVLLIAGKGGENYQEIMGVRHIYNDVSAVKQMLSERLASEKGNNES